MVVKETINKVEKAVKGLNVSSDLFDLMLAGVVKYFTERALAQVSFIGNGNYISGASKLGIGVLIDMFGGSSKIAKIGKTAMVLDGVEDMTQATINLVKGYMPSMKNSNSGNEIQTI